MMFSLLLIVLVLGGCGRGESEPAERVESRPTSSDKLFGHDPPYLDVRVLTRDQDSLQNHPERLSILSDSILNLIKRKEIARLAQFIHPERGLRLSPYGYVDTSDYRLLSAEGLTQLVRSGKVVEWGAYDAIDSTITMDVSTYFDRFVYDQDYLAYLQAVNKPLRGPTTTPDNVEEIYPDCEYVSYRYPGSDPEFEGMDWSGLRLVFLTENERIYLVAIIHDQWTI